MDTPMRHLLVCAATIFLAIGCANTHQMDWDQAPTTDTRPRLLLLNQGGDVVRIEVHGQTLTRAHPGESRCVILPGHVTSNALRLRTTGGGRYELPPVRFDDSKGWVMELGMNPRMDVMGLRPAEPC